ncbi:hypothetical protein E4U24_007597 [Claviceps purpurea]|nr:hypothetical protein E4U24_007597 [Claviceps purpurea]
MELATPCTNFNLKQGADRRETAVNGEHVPTHVCNSLDSWPLPTHYLPTELPTELPNRVHRLIIVRDDGKAVYKASSRQALLACLEGCITGHQSLYQAGILHRDVSLNNLLINEDNETNLSWPHFLIDVDQAIYMDRHDPSERTKVGTGNFMAIGLFDGENHSFVHDLEMQASTYPAVHSYIMYA